MMKGKTKPTKSGQGHSSQLHFSGHDLRRRAEGERTRSTNTHNENWRTKRITELDIVGVVLPAGPCNRCKQHNLPANECTFFPENYEYGRYGAGSGVSIHCEACTELSITCEIAINGKDGSCDHCHTTGKECTNTFASKSASALLLKRCLPCLRSHSKCVRPVVGTTLAVSGASITRPICAIHTKAWYKELNSDDKLVYAVDQIQGCGVRRPNGPCKLCVDRGLPCRTSQRGSLIEEFTKGTLCAGCLDRSSSCQNYPGLTHDQHEAQLDPRRFYRSSARWTVSGAMKRTSSDPPNGSAWDRPTRRLSGATIGTHNHLPWPRSSIRLHHNFSSHTLEPEWVETEVGKIETFIEDFVNTVLCIADITAEDLPRPFTPDNLHRINNFCINENAHPEAILSLPSILRGLLNVVPSGDLTNRIQELELENTSYEEVLRAVIAAYLIQRVFQHKPDELEMFEETLTTGFDPSIETLQKATEAYFGNVLNLSTFQASLNHTASEISEDIFLFAQPLLYMVCNDTHLIRSGSRNDRFRIAQAAWQLNAEIKFKPRCPVEIYCPSSGSFIDRLYEVGIDVSDNIVKMMLMWGVRSARKSDRPLPYAKARVISTRAVAG